MRRILATTLFTFSLLAALNSCGFEPVYAKRDHAPEPGRADIRRAIDGVKVETDNGRNGQIVRIAIEDTLHPSGPAPTPDQYILNVQTQLLEYPAVIQNTQFISRTNIRIQLNGTLRDIKTDKQIWGGTVVRLASFNLSQTADYASYIARDDALKRGLEAAAQDMAMNVEARLSKPKDADFRGSAAAITPTSPTSVNPNNPMMPGTNNIMPGMNGMNGTDGFSSGIGR